MRVLITGAFGFLGGRLTQFLADRAEYDILLGTRRPTQSAPWLPQASIARTDWHSLAALAQICGGADAVVHLSSMNPQDCTADPVEALTVNGVHTANLVGAACRRGVKRFIYFSTANVYSSPLAGTITEATCPTSLHPYATSHRAGEDAVLGAHDRGEIEGIVVRLSTTYGAPAHKDANCWTLLVNDLCRQAVTARRMALHSSGVQRRDFVPVREVCRAIDHLLQLPAPNLEQHLVNVGGQWAPTVWEMASLVQERCEVILGFQPPLTRVPPRYAEASDELDYRLESLLQTGFRPAADKTGEIDRLLEFCKASFSPS